MSRTFTYRFEDGHEVTCESIDRANMLYMEAHHGKCTYNGWAEFMGVGKPSRLGVIGGVNTRGDGFKSGYHPGLNMHISGPAHYARVLQERGMHEVGNEKQSHSRIIKSSIDEEVIGELKQMGAEIGDIAAEELMKPTIVKEDG